MYRFHRQVIVIKISLRGKKRCRPTTSELFTHQSDEITRVIDNFCCIDWKPFFTQRLSKPEADRQLVARNSPKTSNRINGASWLSHSRTDPSVPAADAAPFFAAEDLYGFLSYNLFIWLKI